MKMDRLIAIIMLLLQRRKVSAPELAKMFEVSTRTIYRDIESINQAGVPIVTYPGLNGGIGIMDTFKVDKRLFNMSDFATLLMGLSSISSTIPCDELVTTLAKIKGMVSVEQLKEIEIKTDQVKFDLTLWLGGRNLSLILDTIKMALGQQKTLGFNYNNLENIKSTREVEPYRLLLKGMSWYLQGYCLTENAFETFKLSCMSKMRMTENHYDLRPFVEEDFEQPKKDDDLRIAVTLRVSGAAVEQVSDLFGEECLQPETPDSYIAVIDFPDNDWGYSFLLSLGEDSQCLEPRQVREEFLKRLNKITALYHQHEYKVEQLAQSVCQVG